MNISNIIQKKQKDNTIFNGIVKSFSGLHIFSSPEALFLFKNLINDIKDSTNFSQTEQQSLVIIEITLDKWLKQYFDDISMSEEYDKNPQF